MECVSRRSLLFIRFTRRRACQKENNGGVRRIVIDVRIESRMNERARPDGNLVVTTAQNDKRKTRR